MKKLYKPFMSLLGFPQSRKFLWKRSWLYVWGEGLSILTAYIIQSVQNIFVLFFVQISSPYSGQPLQIDCGRPGHFRKDKHCLKWGRAWKLKSDSKENIWNSKEDGAWVSLLSGNRPNQYLWTKLNNQARHESIIVGL